MHIDQLIRQRRLLVLFLVAGFVARLVYGLSQDALAPYATGGDSWWYLDHGLKLFNGTVEGPPPSAPLYLLFAGWWQTLLPGAGAVYALRLSQALMGTATCYFGYRLARAVSGDQRAGLVAAGALAIAPVFILESAQILTETLYVFLVAGGLTAYVEMVRDANPPRYATLALIALTLGLATMTRAVLLLFPLGLALHVVMVYGLRHGLKAAALLLLVYALVTSIWTIYNETRWHTRVIGAQGLSAFLFIGATEWQAPEQMDAALAEGAGELPVEVTAQQDVYAGAAAQAIGRDPLGWLARRAVKLAEAYAQPHGTLFFSGESLKDLALDWLRQDRSPGGLLRLTGGDQFWPKLALYVFYYTSLLTGLVGLWLTRRNWRAALPLSGFLLYTTLLHLLLEALPRYLFPLSLVWWVFASVTLVAAWDRVAARRKVAVSEGQPIADVR